MTHPYLELLEAKPRTTYEKLGPFTLRVSNKTTYHLYEVVLEGGIVVLRQASKPGLEDACIGLRQAHTDGRVTRRMFDIYISDVNRFLQSTGEVSGKKKGGGK